MNKRLNIISSHYPEVKISGFTSVDGTIEFYGKVNSLLNESMTVLDYGAGRAGWFEDDPCEYRKILRTIKGKVKKVVGCDIDDAIIDNNSVDEKVLIKIGKGLPFENESFDLIISDYVFEHVQKPDETTKELHRILKKGGWLCARTPNKYCYISIFTRIIKNSSHTNFLKYIQPDRKEVDTFPTAFRLNSINDLSKYFDESSFDNFTYKYEAEPAYFFNNKAVFLLMLLINKLLPEIMKVNLFIFLRKK